MRTYLKRIDLPDDIREKVADYPLGSQKDKGTEAVLLFEMSVGTSHMFVTEAKIYPSDGFHHEDYKCYGLIVDGRTLSTSFGFRRLRNFESTCNPPETIFAVNGFRKTPTVGDLLNFIEERRNNNGRE